MANLNLVVLQGHLTADPELKYSQAGGAIANFGIGLNRKWTDKKTGESQERADFFDVTVFGRSAEACAQYLKKGRAVTIQGDLKQDRWKDEKSGANRSKVVVVARNVQFGSSGGSKDEPKGAQEDSSSSETPQAAAAGSVPF